MKLYLAARYQRGKELLDNHIQLLARGHEPTSQWVFQSLSTELELPLTQAATACLRDIDRAEAVVFFAEEPTVGYNTGGRHVEFGYAIAKGKRIFVIGPQENVFHHYANGLPDGTIQIRHFPTWEVFLSFLNLTHSVTRADVAQQFAAEETEAAR